MIKQDIFSLKSFNFRCNGEKECYLDPSVTKVKIENECPASITNLIFFSYRCFHSEQFFFFLTLSCSLRVHIYQCITYIFEVRYISHKDFYSESREQCSSDGFRKRKVSKVQNTGWKYLQSKFSYTGS